MLYVCSLLEMPDHVRALRPDHVVSLLPRDEQPPTPPGLARERHLRIEIDDISEARDGHVLPDVPHVAILIDYLRRTAEGDTILFHCFAGVSRSTAAALIALAVDDPAGVDAAAARLRDLAPHAHPNRRMIAVADELLGFGGRLVAAREAMGPGDIPLSAPLVRIPRAHAMAPRPRDGAPKHP